MYWEKLSGELKNDDFEMEKCEIRESWEAGNRVETIKIMTVQIDKIGPDQVENLFLKCLNKFNLGYKLRCSKSTQLFRRAGFKAY